MCYINLIHTCTVKPVVRDPRVQRPPHMKDCNLDALIAFWLIWFINQRALYNHALSVVVGTGIIGIGGIGVIGIGVVVCAHLPLPQG